jgi:hypothetical protein
VNLVDGACNTNYEPNNTISTPKAISMNTNYYSYICPVDDEDWYSFSNTNSQKHIKVTLTSLPADYDIQLYNPSNVLVGSSANSGTADELIIYNNGPVGTYKVRVYGYNGAMHNTDSYILKASKKSTPWAGRFDEPDEPQDAITQLSVYPNPASDIANVFFFSSEEAAITVSVTDVLGRTLFAETHTAFGGDNELTINVSSFAPGNYFVILQQGENRTVQKFIVE